MSSVKGEVRRAQLITTYGVGAIVAVEDESFMVRGIDQWPVTDIDLHEPRLERALRVNGFMRPPASDGPDIPVTRFPRWHSCSECRRLDLHWNLTSFASNTCNACEQRLVPSRFVIACERGHIDDFPYARWIHAGTPDAGRDHSLTINTRGLTASLASIRLECSCGAERSMEGAFDRDALRGIAACLGKRPWLTADDDSCDEAPRTLQRGASNVWFANTSSALSIPPWSEEAFRALNAHWTVLKAVPDDAIRPVIENLGLVRRFGFSIDDLVEAVKLRKRETGVAARSMSELRVQEFEALTKGTPVASDSKDFVCAPGELGDRGRLFFKKVMLVHRLREVRALTSFTRLQPGRPGVPEDRNANIFVDSPDWLPGIQVTGEGVFFQLHAERLRIWESLSTNHDRASLIDKRYAERFVGLGIAPDRVVTPRLMLVHSLAHALIGQWALESGYPTASLRERLFVSDDMAGILIYTATTDSAGSLGGVVGLAEPERLDAALGEVSTRAGWCSSDPVCIESLAAGVDSLNMAACHACLLLPEVSCEERNLLLDRATLVGVPLHPASGFFTMDHH